MMLTIRAVLGALLLCLVRHAEGSVDPRTSSSTTSAAQLPDAKVAGSSPNAFRIFNAVHSAMRQWGSSVHHNGLSFFPVTVPEGNLFFHGARSAVRPRGLEWLAFELEHAGLFAQCWGVNPGLEPNLTLLTFCFNMTHKWSPQGHAALDMDLGLEAEVAAEGMSTSRRELRENDQQQTLTGIEHNDDHDYQQHQQQQHQQHQQQPDQGVHRGYLHTYRAARPLNLLYLDGSAAAKSAFGSLDSQDLVLIDWGVETPEPLGRDAERGARLCAMGQDWGIDGFVRMEAGFEIIYCDFAEGAGLELVGVSAGPRRGETGEPSRVMEGQKGWTEYFATGAFELVRAAAARYHGLHAGRAEVDFSGMVTAFAYDVNTTNPDVTRPELPRMVATGHDERAAIKKRVGEVLRARMGKATSAVRWQGVVDDVVARFASRLRTLAEARTSAPLLRGEIATLLYPFINFPEDASRDAVAAAVERCTEHHISPVETSKASWTPEDHAIYAAVRTVTGTICKSLFAMRRETQDSDGSPESEESAAVRVQSMARDLRDRLDWTVWKECGVCADPDEMCFIAMFPFGKREDYFTPSCKKANDIGYGYFIKPGWFDSQPRELD